MLDVELIFKKFVYFFKSPIIDISKGMKYFHQNKAVSGFPTHSTSAQIKTNIYGDGIVDCYSIGIYAIHNKLLILVTKIIKQGLNKYLWGKIKLIPQFPN